MAARRNRTATQVTARGRGKGRGRGRGRQAILYQSTKSYRQSRICETLELLRAILYNPTVSLDGLNGIGL